MPLLGTASGAPCPGHVEATYYRVGAQEVQAARGDRSADEARPGTGRKSCAGPPKGPVLGVSAGAPCRSALQLLCRSPASFTPSSRAGAHNAAIWHRVEGSQRTGPSGAVMRARRWRSRPAPPRPAMASAARAWPTCSRAACSSSRRGPGLSLVDHFVCDSRFADSVR